MSKFANPGASTEMRGNDLPAGWYWTKLGDVLTEAQAGFACGERDPEVGFNLPERTCSFVAFCLSRTASVARSILVLSLPFISDSSHFSFSIRAFRPDDA
jgi:hypothetical protein